MSNEKVENDQQIDVNSQVDDDQIETIITIEEEEEQSNDVLETETDKSQEASFTESVLEVLDISDDKSLEESVKSEQKNVKTSRELKSLLELSKEAKLDTNISYKRKSVDQIKLTEKADMEVLKQSGKIQNQDINNKVQKVLDVVELKNNSQITEKCDKSTKNLKRNNLTGITGGASDCGKKGRISLEPIPAMSKPDKDNFCWRCHRIEVTIFCETCPRAFHVKCLKQNISNPEHWPCPECVNILNAESTRTRSRSMKGMTLEQLCVLLKFAWKRMVRCSETEPFLTPVNETEFPDYKKYIINPMDLTKLEVNLKNNLYGSTVAFEADTKWILHNSIIFNSYQSKLTTTAKAILKSCKQEMVEIENCATCYLNANTRKDWFVEVCPKPHLLVWAKLKGFPYWPAKAMTTNSSGMVDVRFFGAHDRAWVPIKDCFLYSEKDPNSNKIKRSDITKSIEELEVHIEKLKEVYEQFNYAPFKVVYDPEQTTAQLKMFLPNYIPVQENDDSDSTATLNGSFKSIESDTTKRISDLSSKELSLILNKESTEDASTHTDEDILNSDEEMDEVYYNFVKNSDQPVLSEKKLRKRPSSETLNTLPRKSIRKISEQSDSSHLSTLSEKIEKVDSGGITEPSSTNSEEGNINVIDNISSTSHVLESETVIIDICKSDLKEVNKDQTVCNELKISDKIMKKLKQNKNTEESLENVKKIIGVDSLKVKIREKMDISAIELDQKNNAILIEETNNISTPVDSKPSDPSAESTVSTTNEESLNSIAKEDDVNAQEKANDKQALENKITTNSDENNKSANSSGVAQKFIRLVDIKSITMPNRKNESILEKQLISIKQNKANADKQKSQEQNTASDISIDIKSEPTSDIEIIEHELLENKRLIFSALHIQEKPTVEEKQPKQRRILTRSKTEEIYKSVSRVPEPETIVLNDTAKTPDAVLSSLAKDRKQKARKTFPRPGDNTNNNTLFIKPIVPQANIEKQASISTTISQNTITTTSNLPSKNTNTNFTTSQTQVLNTHQSNVRPVPALILSLPSNKDESPKATAQADPVTTTIINTTTNTQSHSNINNQLVNMLNGIAPQHISKPATTLFCRAPPPLKPRPPGPLSTYFEEGAPSSAGPVTEKINSIAYRLSDYFRGMLIETINDMSTADNPEIALANLRIENERLKSKHQEEIVEIKKNITTILQDIQRSVMEDKLRCINETKAACEVDAIRRVQEAKSKQWCANCYKEAQFYCCWNTSYCDFPCQRNHWPRHMNKCAQHVSNPPGSSQNLSPSKLPMVVRPALATNKTIFGKPTKLILNRAGNNKQPVNFVRTSTGNVAIIDSTTAGIEVLTNGSISLGGKVLGKPTIINKVKPVNIIAVSSSNSTATQHATAVTTTANVQKPSTNTSNVTNNISGVDTTSNLHTSIIDSDSE